MPHESPGLKETLRQSSLMSLGQCQAITSLSNSPPTMLTLKHSQTHRNWKEGGGRRGEKNRKRRWGGERGGEERDGEEEGEEEEGKGGRKRMRRRLQENFFLSDFTLLRSWSLGGDDGCFLRHQDRTGLEEAFLLFPSISQNFLSQIFHLFSVL